MIPNGVEVGSPPPPPRPARAVTAGQPLRLVFVGAAVERKGLGILLRAFEALREHVPAELTVIGAGEQEIAPLLLERHGVTALGKVDDTRKAACLREADVLVAPSLGGESFGMVLTEAFAAGVPVVASDIPGYAGVVRDGLPVLAPEIVLLFKAKQPSAKDEADFGVLEPRLEPAARTWLAGALRTAYAGHRWIEQLA